jgi:Flp pilus assembly pilin Flp
MTLITVREDGQTTAEYAVVLGVISAIMLLALTFLSSQVAAAVSAAAGVV